MKMKDRISNLPDEILSYILSFLPTKEAVATSVLCKRWIPLWCSVSTLDFDDGNNNGSKERHSRFVHSVNRVILSRDFNQPIQKFRLGCFSPHFDDLSHVIVWVNAVLQGRVEHLDISLRFLSTFNLSSIFSCTTLVVLKLKGLMLKTTVSSVDLPFLKVLHLQDLLLPSGGCLAELLSGCPVLKNLKTKFYVSQIVADRKFTTSPNLVKADISEPWTNNFMMKVVNNVQFLRIREIYRLPYGGEVTHMFHNLTHIQLVYEKCNRDWFEVVKFLEYCPKLQVLVINQPHFDDFVFEQTKLVDWQNPPCVPECILLHLQECHLNDYRGTKCEFQFARYIMQNGRYLKRMTICSNTLVKEEEKLKNKQKLFSCTRSSSTCELYYK